MNPAGVGAAEQALLGTVLRRPSLALEAASVVEPEDFTDARHSLIWAALDRLVESRQDYVSLARVVDELRATASLETAGGQAYFQELLLASVAPNTAIVIAGILRTEAHHRRLAIAPTVEPPAEVTCPSWCVLSREEHDAEAIAEGWAWHRGQVTFWKADSGTAFEARLSGTTGLDGIRGETDTLPQIEISADGPMGLNGEIPVGDVNHVVTVLRDLVGLEQRTRRAS